MSWQIDEGTNKKKKRLKGCAWLRNKNDSASIELICSNNDLAKSYCKETCGMCIFTLRSTTADLDVKMYTAATLRRLSEIIHATKNCYAVLLSALVKASSWSRTSCIAEAFLSQSKVEQNRRILVEHHGFLHAISKLSLTVGGAELDGVREAIELYSRHLTRDHYTVANTLQNKGALLFTRRKI